MYSNMSPSFATSLDMGGSKIIYFAFLTRWTSGYPLNIGFRYVGVQVTGTSLWDFIVGWSSLYCGDCLVDVLLEN